MAVHPRAVVPEEGFRHEGGRLAVAPRDIANHVLVQVHLVARSHKGVETDVDFRLASGRHFVVLPFDLHAQILQHQRDLVADILLCVGWRHREIPLLVADLIPGVRHLLATAVEDALSGVDLVEGAARGGVVTDIVEDEEFRFRSKVGGVPDLGALEILLRPESDAARVPLVGLHRDRIDDGANKAEGGFGVERIDHGGRWIGKNQHVGGVDRLPSADRGPVEAEALLEGRLLEFRQRCGEVLPGSGDIAEFIVHQPAVVGLGKRQDLFARFCIQMFFAHCFCSFVLKW